MSNVPSSLFKYKSIAGDGFRHVIDMMENERIFLSTHTMMNDPEEGDILLDDAFQNGFGAWKASLDDRIKARSIIDSTRYCSFCLDPDLKLLWSHYANAYKGIALEYKFASDVLGSSTIKKIQYSARPYMKRIDFEAMISEQKRPFDLGMFTYKSPEWAYEKEYRLFHAEHGQMYFKLRPSSVILGKCYASDAMSNSLIEIAKACNIKVKYLMDGDCNRFDVFDPLA